MNTTTWYEESADARDYMYFQNFPNMDGVKYRFGEVHVHKSIEMLVIYSGKMRCTVNNHTEELTAGSVFIANSHDTHHYEYVGNAGAYILVISKDYFEGILDEKTEFQNFLRLPKNLSDALVKLLRENYSHFAHFNVFHKRSLTSQIIAILCQTDLFREKEVNSNKEFFIKTSDYILAHYGEDLRLPVLAKQFGYSENYFSALFNKTVGTNLNEYVNRIRIRKVLEMKNQYGKKYTLKEIVTRCGFNSMETYYRVLKKYKEYEEQKQGETTVEEKEKIPTRDVEKKTAVIVGLGNRGQVYADYSFDCPNEFGVAAVVDPNPFKREMAMERYKLSEKEVFATFQEFVESGIPCDFAINATMDQYHYAMAMQILSAGYDMLMEKPIVPNEKELMDIQRLAEKNGCNVFVCHVLRYAPYYRRIKELLNSGAIGKIMTMEMNEHVCIAHYMTAYVRGKWRSEENCGSGFLLAKCCHDLDLMCWLNNASEPKTVSSFGQRVYFTPENKPEGAAEYCYQCKYERHCPYSAIKLYIEMNAMPFLTWDRLNKPLDEITEEEKMEFLKTDIYGKCAYETGGDLVDRQNVIVSFENGSCCAFTLVGGSVKADRYIHIVGTTGEIEGKLEENKFTLRKYIDGSFNGTSEIVDVTDEVVNNAKYGGHNGGDFAIMRDLIGYLNGDRSSVSITKLSDSINGHLCIFAAEQSRKKQGVVEIAALKNS